MAGVRRHLMGSSTAGIDLSVSRNNNRAPFPLKIRCNGAVSATPTRGVNASVPANALAAEGPSCIFARSAYYSGKPLIVDDMFDRVELKLRRYGSKSVVKYPRCSLRRQLTYADAEEDPSQVFALASVWLLFLAFGSSACLLPTIYTVGLAYRDAFSSGLYSSTASLLEFLDMLTGVLFMALGAVIGFPVATASIGALQGLWRNDLVALKGSCPSCGEEVFAFVRLDKSGNKHRADCHQSMSGPRRKWVYGRVYLVPGRNRRKRWV
ncbi:hypothetical protein RJ641_032873 [Dillenia turbinata]|uniref:Uncharacterized protein n=1 Tax=Dillenia turbinata TaxID=194707 RepID=A0AAN8VIT1_9MAGN